MSLSTIRDILVHVDGSVDGRARVRYALALARLCDAHLTCVHVTPRADPPPLYRPSQIDAATDFAEQALARDNRAASEIFRRETIGLSYVEWLS
ncbi:universal stress protein, partial [Mycobacterium tuberculosis]